jgi:hypothetical protein
MFWLLPDFPINIETSNKFYGLKNEFLSSFRTRKAIKYETGCNLTVERPENDQNVPVSVTNF